MIEFAVWAPSASSVELILGELRCPMELQEHGWWRVKRSGDEARAGYKFSVDGSEPYPDPRSAWQPDGVHGPSYVVDHDSYCWQHNFRPGPIAAGIVYELHIGTFTDEGTYVAAIDKLDHLVSLGVTHIEVMPIAEFPGNRGWGYDGVALYAPHHAYGTPDQLKDFVDACHSKDLAVLLDVVYNHLGPDGNYLDRYGPYFTSTYDTPWGSAINFDHRGSTEVRRFFINNALMWLRDYRFDGLRLDAVHSVFDNSAVHFLEQLGSEVEALSISLDRDLALVAESDLNNPRLVWSRERGGYQLHAVWSDDFHHAVHAVLTGERNGYYRDFGTITDVAKALTDVYVYDGRYSETRERNHGRPVGDLTPRKFVVASQNHDQIGNRAQGDRLEHIAGLQKAKIAAALTLLGSCIPMLFQGEEWAASSPFLYFTDHEARELANAVSEGRKREFVEFGWNPSEIPDPQDVSTFDNSRLKWDEVNEAPHAEMLDWYRSLVDYRRANSHALSAPVTAAKVDLDKGWLWIARGSFHLAVNFFPSAVAIPIEGEATELLTTGTADLRDGSLYLSPITLACFFTR